MLVIASPDTARARAMLDIARRLNPGVQTVVRTHSDEEAALMKRERVDAVFMGEHELARGMARATIERFAGDPTAAGSAR